MPDARRRAYARAPVGAALLAVLVSPNALAQGRSSASAQITLRAVVPVICSIRSHHGTIRLTGTTDRGERVEHHGQGHGHHVHGEASLSVLCNTPYAMGVERRLRRIEHHHDRDHRGRPRVDAPGTSPIVTASTDITALPGNHHTLNHHTLDLGVALHVTGNGAVHESHCVLAPPAGPVNEALLPAGAPCGVRSSLDDASRPLARADTRLIITGSLAATSPAAPFATGDHPESGTRVADLAPLPPYPRPPQVQSDVPPPSLLPPTVQTRPVYELDHISFSVAAKF